MRVVIVSKTRMTNAACVGAIEMSTGRSIRLLNENGYNQPADTNFDVGDIWDVECTPRPDRVPPHTEDMLMYGRRYVGQVDDLLTHITNSNFPIWRGGLESLFGGMLHFSDKGSCYAAEPNLPNQSTGFWIPDRALIRDDKFKVKFCYRQRQDSWVGQHCLPYVGYAEPLPQIPAGTLLRVSLARPWAGVDGKDELHCWLQLSGWYTRVGTAAPQAVGEDNDLPF